MRLDPMNGFGVLSNRKRAVVALVHSIVFLGVALHGFVAAKAGVFGGSGTAGDFVLIPIYLIVASVLLWLASISRAGMERIYFALCTTSATCGLLRTMVGDRMLPPAQYA